MTEKSNKYTLEEAHGVTLDEIKPAYPVDLSEEINSIWELAETLVAYTSILDQETELPEEVVKDAFGNFLILMNEAMYLFDLIKAYIDLSLDNHEAKIKVRTHVDLINSHSAVSSLDPNPDDYYSATEALNKQDPDAHVSFVEYLLELSDALSKVVLFCKQRVHQYDIGFESE